MTMSIVTKLIGDKREWRAYKARTAKLPEPYRITTDAVERYLLTFGPGRTEPIMTMLEDLADLFEQSAANGTTVREVVGDDPVEFVETFLRNYADTGWVAKERAKLTDAVERAERLQVQP
jgi:DNA-binding ferritin-like protein (Dps family)